MSRGGGRRDKGIVAQLRPASTTYSPFSLPSLPHPHPYLWHAVENEGVLVVVIWSLHSTSTTTIKSVTCI